MRLFQSFRMSQHAVCNVLADLLRGTMDDKVPGESCSRMARSFRSKSYTSSGHSGVVRFEARAVLQVSNIDASLRLLDLCHSAFVAVAIWDSLITFYGDSAKVDVIPW